MFKTASFSKEIAPFDFEYFNLKTRHKNCYGGYGKENYDEIKNSGCNTSNIEVGLKEFLLIMDCSSCNIKTQFECASFNICIYDETLQKEWCEEEFQDKDFALRKIDCPKEIIKAFG